MTPRYWSTVQQAYVDIGTPMPKPLQQKLNCLRLDQSFADEMDAQTLVDRTQRMEGREVDREAYLKEAREMLRKTVKTAAAAPDYQLLTKFASVLYRRPQVRPVRGQTLGEMLRNYRPQGRARLGRRAIPTNSMNYETPDPPHRPQLGRLGARMRALKPDVQYESARIGGFGLA